MRNVEQLETRRLFASFTAASVADLIADINAANAAGGSNTITLKAGTTFSLNAVDNSTDGPTGLPVVAAGDNLSIIGNGDSIQRSTAKGVPAFRLFDVVSGASLTLNNLTLSRGAAPSGGGVFNQGTLTLSGVTVQDCVAQGSSGNANGGGVFSAGVLAIADSAIKSNQALGANPTLIGSSGGGAAGGGLFVGGGNATVTNSTFSSNAARGGDGANGGKFYYPGSKTPFLIRGGAGGSGYGGGIGVFGGTLALAGTAVSGNSATAGTGGSSPGGLAKGADGAGCGGGMYIASAASASLDSFSVAHTSGNTASTSDNDIFGTYTILA